MQKKYVRIGLLLTLLLLVIHLAVIDDYGLSWDYHHVFFGGLYHLKQPRTSDMVDDHLPFTAPDPRIMEKTPFGPIMTSIPVASYLMFYSKLKLLPFDIAVNLPTVIIGVAGIFVLYLFLLEVQGFPTALTGLIFLALYPRYVGDIHFNMKDIPTTVFYTLSIWLFWRLVKFHGFKDLLLAASSFAVAFNMKVNAVMIPATLGFWTVFLFVTKKIPRNGQHMLPILSYFFFAPALAFIIWSIFWENPVAELKYMFEFFTYNTIGIEVRYFGHWYSSTYNVPWHYPFGYLAVVTPLPILMSFLVGLISLIRHIRQKPFSSLFLLWFFLPLTRYLSPKIGVLDGIRHFEEVVPALVAIAAVGAVHILKMIKNKTGKILFIAITFVWLSANVILYHPYQITYFNELVGGVKGALGKFDLDYWGTSQKQAVLWINKHAAKDSKVYIVMSGDVSGKFLRPDLLAHLNSVPIDQADYVILLNRVSFFYRYWVSDYALTHTPIHVIDVLGVPLTFIYDNKTIVPRMNQWW